MVDGNDVLAVYEAAGKLIKKAREGGGPSILECKTWRHMGHFVGDPEKYRTPEETAAWMTDEKDPIPRFGNYLTDQGVAGAEDLEKIRAAVDDEIAKAVEFAIAAEYPKVEDLLKDVFVES